MFDLQPSVTAKKKTGGSITTQRIKTQLRTGYCYLNGYLHIVGLKDSPVYTCGESESVKHYIEDCEQYEEIREYCCQGCSMARAVVNSPVSCSWE